MKKACNILIYLLARPRGIEPLTKNLEGSCSIQLSYGRTWQGRRALPCGGQYSDSAPLRQAFPRIQAYTPLRRGLRDGALFYASIGQELRGFCLCAPADRQRALRYHI